MTCPPANVYRSDAAQTPHAVLKTSSSAATGAEAPICACRSAPKGDTPRLRLRDVKSL